MNKMLTLATVAFIGLAGSAQAAEVAVTLGSGSTASYASSSASLAPNVNLGTVSGLTLNNAQVVPAGSNSAGNYSSPSGTLFGGTYLSVFGVPTTGTATLALAAGNNNFGFTWGTVDTYNTLTLTDSRNVTYTITGTNLLNAIAGSVAGATQSDVSFYDPYGTIVSAVLTSTDNAFEAGNFSESVSAVPLPASLPLFGAGLVGLFMIAQRKKLGKSM